MKEKDPVIYMIRNKKNGLRYYGQTVNFKRRLNEYKNRRAEKSSKYHIMEIINNEGFENFEFSIVEHCDEKDLNEREMYYIKKHNTTNPLFGYNSQKGENDKRMFKRTREKMSKSHTGLKEKASTKRKKSNAVVAFNGKEVVFADSGKLFGDYIGQTKDIISHGIKNRSCMAGYYVFYQDQNKQDELILRYMINKTKYMDALRVTRLPVETIEQLYEVKYLTYTDLVE